MFEKPTSAIKIISSVLEPHVELSMDLMKLVNSSNTSDPTYRFQIASLIVFLSGIDKTLNIAFGLLYLSGRVDWNWMAPSKKMKAPLGFIECQRGLSAKVEKLNELGVNISYLEDLICVRNEFIHGSTIYIGYSERLEENGEVTLKPYGPEVSFPFAPIIHFSIADIRNIANCIANSIGTYIDQTDWTKKYLTLSQKIESLPQNPEPEYSLLLNDQSNVLELINMLNQKFIGDGANLVID